MADTYETSPSRRAHVSIVVPCKGRLHHLRRTLPNMLAQQCDFPFEVIVVDFSCPQGTYDWCRELNVWNLTALKVLDGAETFNHSRARNCGASVAEGRVLAFVDADVRLEPEWLARATRAIRSGSAGLARVAPGSMKGCQCQGTCAVSADLYHAVRGYDEAICGWNSEDLDLYCRAEAIHKKVRFGGNLLTPIEHSDEERGRYQTEKNVGASNARNRAYVASRQTAVNANDYGQGRFEIFRGAGQELPPIVWTKHRRIVRILRT